MFSVDAHNLCANVQIELWKVYISKPVTSGKGTEVGEAGLVKEVFSLQYYNTLPVEYVRIVFRWKLI